MISIRNHFKCMNNLELTRENINYELIGLGMQLRYLRDALMCSFMDVPVNYFITLRGNLPAKNEERIPFLECMATNVDVEFFKEAKTLIFNTNDKELVSKFCELDLVVWQLVMLSSRFEEEHFAVKRIADMAGELLQLVYFLKVEMLHKEFFKFNAVEIIQTRLLLERIAKEKAEEQSADNIYAGWSQLEDASKACDNNAKNNIFMVFANHGKLEIRSALEPEKVKELYLLLGEYRTATGPKNDMGVIDMSKISLNQFENALWHGCYTGFEENGRNDKLRFVIVHFSKAYIKNWKAYRNCAARSMGLSYEQLCKYTKDKQFATKLQKVLPLVDYNNT